VRREEAMTEHVIGYLDHEGNVVEEDTAEEQVRLLNEAGGTPVSLASLYTKVEASDYYQVELDTDEDNPAPVIYRIIEEN
jgi:hypothetical protein